MSDIKLSHISLLKSAVSTAFQAYIGAELGDSSVAHDILKGARYEYTHACVEFVENLLDMDEGKGENVCNENETQEI